MGVQVCTSRNKWIPFHFFLNQCSNFFCWWECCLYDLMNHNTIHNGTWKLKQKVLLSPNQTRVEQVARVLLPFIGRTQSGTSTTSTLQEGLCFVACSLLFACLVAKDRPPKFEWQPGGSCWNACLYFHFQYGDFKSYTWVYNLDNTCEWDQASCSVSPITATHDFNCGTFIGIVW